MLFISKRILNFGEQTPTAVEHTSTPVNSRSTPVETSPPPISKDDRSEKLVDLVVKTAIKTKGSALFSGKSKAAIRQVIRDTNPTEDDLTSVTDHFVKKMDKFQLQNAGSFIAENLRAWLGILSEARAKPMPAAHTF
jgi:hypothetical protein